MSECGDEVLQRTGKYHVFSVEHHSPDDSLLSYSFFRKVHTYAHPGIIDHLMFYSFPPHPAGTQLIGYIEGS